ncbi:eCIS core domain-containing protein [Limnofasciculus baicalensis]|uniref:DUF4157 domain-containing protein n=1 Tax=Limnofasciculus baicalensis BBK-W-15 TaxID=2699891 RepID=A0AAE3GRV3_9CYAN|nr:DUF4157 domain-containing protein [Limnofasciculus baicalensis]MCP2729521.1 DUF4157 domain-containing protein [Limnofasciculus baicalensis BBK-W-15]
MSSRKRIQRKNPWEPTPAPDILKSRPFSNGLGSRESKLPTTNDILQTRPFSPRDKDVSTPKDTRSFEEKMIGAEFRYNGVSIPTVQREEVEEENSQEQAEGETSAANISVFAPSAPPLENSILSPFSLLQTDGLGEQETVQREEVSVGEEEKEGFEVGIEKQQRQASPDDGTIQRLCAECEGELAEKEEKEPIQAKLTVGEVGDKYEQEADAVARDVVEKINAPQQEQSVQRQSELGETSVPNITVMRRGESVTGGGSDVIQDVEQGIQQAKGGGQGLDESIREPMEGAFGADFSGVKVHTDAQSDQLNRSIQAKAFTTGQDIFFKQGEYDPGSKGGQELLAHELTHVVQQTGAVQRNLEVGKKDTSQEKEVDSISQVITENEQSGYTSASEAEVYPESEVKPLRTKEQKQPTQTEPVPQEEVQKTPESNQVVNLLSAVSNPQYVQAQTIAMQPSCRETGRYPGNQEHLLIEQDYKHNINSNSAVEFSIPSSGPNGGIGYADIVDLTNYAIYEIKTYPGSAQGVVEAERYRSFAQKNCDQNVIWQIGTQYPKRVIPFDAQNELVAQQYPQFPGVITYYKRKRKQEEKEKVYQEIVKFIKRVVETGEDVDAAVQRFLTEHPEVKNYLIGAAVGIAIATLAEDILTAGAGILDDPASFAVVWALIRAARAVP